MEGRGWGMHYFTRTISWDLKDLRKCYDWNAIERPNRIIVDVGGGYAAVSQYLAYWTLHLRLIDQFFLTRHRICHRNNSKGTRREDLLCAE